MGTGKNKKIEEKKEKRETERQRDSQGTIAFSNYFYIFYLDWNIYIIIYLVIYPIYLSFILPVRRCRVLCHHWDGLGWSRVASFVCFLFPSNFLRKYVKNGRDSGIG